MTDRQIWRQFETFQKRYERKYAKQVYALLRRQARQIAAYLVENGIEQTIAAMSLLIRRQDVADLLQRLYTDVGVRWANIEYGNILDQVKGYDVPVRTKAFGFNAEWEAILNIFFTAYGGDKITSIDETTKEWLIRKIIEGREAGLGPEQIARSMRDDKTIPLARARVISRTETVAAANFGGMTAARRSGLRMNKRWVNAHDGRVRETHKDVAQGGVGGEVVPLEQPFSNGMMHPGDPQGGAKEVIQCRCIVSTRPARDGNGMPIRA
ncbi:phage minor head protein [Chitinophaga rhizosphaerae]|uniref:phage minor head protein n=1 Tax=Chitinophaga rhizosphaerae TaxID=1864947 RepID=UPI000F804327|nr:phage minor head protein [Chitinophaga rhizosphaerae]